MKRIIQLVFFAFALNVQGQDANKITHAEHVGKYLYKGHFHEFKDLKNVFYEFEDTKRIYDKKYIKNKVLIPVWIIGAGASFIGVKREQDNCPPHDECSVGGVILYRYIIAGCTAGLVISIANKHNAKRNAIKYYNAHFDEGLNSMHNKSDLQLQLSGSSIGLCLTF